MNDTREHLLQLLCGATNLDDILNQQDWLIETIPEIKPMIGMKQYNPNHCYTIWDHTLQSMIHAPNNAMLRLTMLFHDIGKPVCFTRDEEGIGHFYGHPKESCHIAERVLKRLGFKKGTISQIDKLIFYHDAQIPSKSIVVRRWLNRLGETDFKMLIEVKRADILAQSVLVQDIKLEKLEKLQQKLSQVIEQTQEFGVRDLNIDGRHLIQNGISQGREIGIILDQLVEQVKNSQIENTKDELLKMVNVIFQNK